MVNPFDATLSKLSFNDIKNFCASGIPEGLQLDYKREAPDSTKLSKLIAAFSNTQGGYILIGVEEDRTTGKPSAWVGIQDTAAALTAIDQAAANINPLPTYSRQLTDEVNGKAFIIVQVSTGQATPYYVFNDSNIWIRTGSLRKSIDIASPEMQEILYRTRESAEKARNNNFRYSEDIVNASILRINNEINQYNKASESRSFEKIDRLKRLECIVTVQPYMPHVSSIKPSVLKKNLQQIRYREFPNLNCDTIQKGMYHRTSGKYTDTYRVEQVYTDGFMSFHDDVTRINNGDANLFLGEVCGNLFIVLGSSCKFYELLDYTGPLHITLSLKNTLNQHVHPFYRISSFGELERALLNNYHWDFETDTNELIDKDARLQLYYRMADELQTAFNYNGSTLDNTREALVASGLD
jgi:hypothetical protein